MDFDLYTLKIFRQVMEDGGFSAAARTLKMTQPTVSQHVARLEEGLKGKLFQRVGHQVIPTDLAQELLVTAQELLQASQDFSERLQRRQSAPAGLVRYAMPESCQWTPHYRAIMAQIRTLPEIRFRISILPNEMILQELLEGRHDFGFVVGERASPELRFQHFSDEPYVAVAATRSLLESLQKDHIAKLRLVTFPGWEGFFQTWARHHGQWAGMKSKLPPSVLHIGTLAGAIHAVEEGAGTGIFPYQCVQEAITTRALTEWSEGRKERATSPVYVARRIAEPLPRRCQVVLDMLLQAKKK